MNRFFIFLVIIFFLSSCEKEAGEGGTSSIIGSVYEFTVIEDLLTNQIDTIFNWPYAEKDVYIIYSNNENDFYDDKIETNWNGQYRFDFLRKGDYTIFMYKDSIDALNVEYEIPIFQHIKIESNNTSYTLQDFMFEIDLPTSF